MAFGWAHIVGSAVTASLGPVQSLQFKTGETNISGSDNLMFMTGSDQLRLTGSLLVNGTIQATNYQVTTTIVSQLSASGASKFGDSADDTHEFSGSILVSGNVGIGTKTASYPLHVVSTTSSRPEVVIENSNADANGSNLYFLKSTANVDHGDTIGNFLYSAKNSAGATKDYAKIIGGVTTKTNGSEDGQLVIQAMRGGTLRPVLNIYGGTSGGVVVNEGAQSQLSFRAETANEPHALFVDASNDTVIINDGGASLDFRVESNNLDHALFVDGSADGVGIGWNSAIATTGSVLSVRKTNGLVGNTIAAYTNSGALGAAIGMTNVGNTYMRLFNTSSVVNPMVQLSTVGDSYFLTGNVGFGKTTAINAGAQTTSRKLTVYGAVERSILELGSLSNSNGSPMGSIQFGNNANADNTNFDADSKVIAQVQAQTVTSDSNASDDSGGDLYFYTKPEAGTIAARMVISSAGGVGIGVTDPDQALEVAGAVHISTEQGSSPSAPANGDGGLLYPKADGHLYWVSNDVAEVAISNLITAANGVDNRIATFSAATALNGEASLTYDGTVLHVSGGLQHKRVYKTGDYTVTTNDYFIGVNTSGGAVTLTLPAAAAANDGQEWVIKDEGGNAGSNNITITGSNDTNTIDGGVNALINSEHGAINIYCDGVSKYFIF